MFWIQVSILLRDKDTAGTMAAVACNQGFQHFVSEVCASDAKQTRKRKYMSTISERVRGQGFQVHNEKCKILVEINCYIQA